MGPALYAYTRSAIPTRSSLAILSIAALFIIALVIFAVKGKEMKAAEGA
jgi:hypothetical protein